MDDNRRHTTVSIIKTDSNDYQIVNTMTIEEYNRTLAGRIENGLNRLFRALNGSQVDSTDDEE